MTRVAHLLKSLLLGLCITCAALPVRAVTYIPGSTTFTVNIASPTGSLILTGHTAPNSLVTFVNNGSVIGTTIAGPEGKDGNSQPLPAGYFEKQFTGLSEGKIIVGTFSSDADGKVTPTINREAMIFVNQTTSFDPMLLPPTIKVNKNPLKRPDTQLFSGFAYTGSKVVLYMDDNSVPLTTNADSNGHWEVNPDKTFHLGDRGANSVAQESNGAISESSQSISFNVSLSADLNLDQKVSLTDFSILMFNYGRSPYTNIPSDINDDGPIDLVDFSVMMFYWTGG